MLRIKYKYRANGWAKACEGLRIHYTRSILDFEECGWHAGAAPGAAHGYRHDNIAGIVRALSQHEVSERQGHAVLDFVLASPGLRPLPPPGGRGDGGEAVGREKTDRLGSRKLHGPAPPPE